MTTTFHSTACKLAVLLHTMFVFLFQAGVYSAILYFMMGVVVLSGGQLADILRQRSLLSITNVRKLFTCTGLYHIRDPFVSCYLISYVGSKNLQL